MAEIYQAVSITAFSLSGISLIFAVFCFIKFKIPKIIGDLSGRTAKRSIAQMRTMNEKSIKTPYRPASSVKETRPIKKEAEEKPEKKESKKKFAFSKKSADDATELLAASGDTELLEYDGQATTLLGGDTEALGKRPAEKKKDKSVERFELVQDIILLHTEEVI